MKNAFGASMIVLGILIAGGSGLFTFYEIYVNGLITSRSAWEQLSGGFLNLSPIVGFIIGLLLLALGTVVIVVRVRKTSD